MERKGISIIIACYNAAAYLEGCLASIRQLDIANLQVVIVDGLSTDKTLDIASAAGIPSLTIASGPDAGIYDALNKGIDLATGKWLYFMGADDRLLPGFVALLKEMDNDNTIYYGNAEPFHNGTDPGFTIMTGPFTKYRIAKFVINHQSILYPASLFDHHRYDLKYRVYADYALNIKAWGDKRFRKKFIPLTIARYFLNGFSANHQDPVFEQDKPMLLRKHLGWMAYLRYSLKRWKKKFTNAT